LVLARQINHREWISALLSNLGSVEIELGNYSQAEMYFQEGLDAARQIGHREWISLLLLNLGLTFRKQGNYQLAKEHLQESLVLARQIGIHQITANILYEYGNLHLDQQQLENAKATFQEMLSIISEENQDLLALAQYGLARTTLAQGNITEALNLGRNSVETLETMGHRSAQEVKQWINLQQEAQNRH
jgi:tetratricopeptide (TPR) repeat protein